MKVATRGRTVARRAVRRAASAGRRLSQRHDRGTDVRSLRRRIRRLEAALSDQRRRVDQLEDEVQEARQYGRRVAELGDVVSQLLALSAARDDERFRDAVRSYVDVL